MEFISAMDIPGHFGAVETMGESKKRHFKTPCFKFQSPNYITVHCDIYRPNDVDFTQRLFQIIMFV
ncbi:hypothetical protein DPMN_026283 [Dreissena polymorpha]|uniref:Uncharacterized protein n=1 Tax=Dreissena polymorpha TaxID=45954 RepID=A0A9D4LQU4_DREPO|nr:hypothetical protein DPMN_026283 [Dreissena polymorpha]